jgi:hypothetical protein
VRPVVDPATRTGRLFLYANAVVVLACASVVAATVGTGWSWPLFIWGAALGPLSIAVTALMGRLAIRSQALSADRVASVRERMTARNWSVNPTVVASAVSIAILGAAFDTVWADVIMTVVIVLSNIAIPLVVLVTRARPRRSRTP